MKYSVNTGNRNYTFNEVVLFFTKQFLKLDNIKDGINFLHHFGEYVEQSDFPCNKITLYCFTGYSDKFGLKLSYNNEEIVYITIGSKSFNLLKLYNSSYMKKDFSMFAHIIEKYFDLHNQKIFDDWVTKCKITKTNCIEIYNYDDYKLKDTTILNGTIEEVFDKYTAINDKYKYCNGRYVRFKDENISSLYYIFTNNFKGNYFLENALKRGVVID